MSVWYLVQTKPRQEQVARENLERQRFGTYLPTLVNARRRAGRWRRVVEPLFPGYLFVRIDPGHDDVGVIRSTRGVVGLVRFGTRLLPVPDAVIDSLLCAQGGDEQAPIDTTALFEEGDPVCFVEGPLAGREAIVCARTGTERVAVLLTLLGREQRVEVSPHVLAPSKG